MRKRSLFNTKVCVECGKCEPKYPSYLCDKCRKTVLQNKLDDETRGKKR